MSFLWGAATSSHQIEGGNRENDWWDFEAKGVVDGGVRSGQASDHWRLFREDLRLAKEMGLNSYRFSFEWSRFEPDEDEWRSEAVDWYAELIAECERLGLLPMATLHHFTTPRWLAAKGGWANDETPRRFEIFTRKIARTFGARVPLWCTINEPFVLVAGGYLGRFMPPGEYDPRGASHACRNLLRAHVLAYDTLHREISRREGPFRERPLEVGFAHNMLHFKPERKYHPIERALAYFFSRLYNDSWLASVNGERQRFGFPGVFPFAPQLASARARRTFDFIGLNYYTKSYVQWRPRTQAKERDSNLPIGMSFARRKEVASDLGWAIHPRGFSLMLEKLRRFRAPIYITENGIADATDAHRPGYLRSHLDVLAKARTSGLDVRGYYHWSLMDNFEWIKGFAPRFGLYHVDYETFARKPRASARLYAEIIAAHRGEAPNSAILASLTQT